MKIKTIVFQFIHLFVLVFVMSCTNKNVEKAKNETEREIKLSQQNPVDANSEKQSGISQQTTNIQAEILKAEQSGNVSELTAIVQKIFEQAVQNSGSDSRASLSILNRALIAIAEKDENQFATFSEGKYLKLYIEKLTQGCDVNLSGCKNLSLFVSDMNSSKVILKIAKIELTKSESSKICRRDENFNSRLAEYYCLLDLAFEVKNRVPDHEFSSMYLLKAEEYSQALKATDPKKLDKFNRILQLIVMNFDFSVASEDDKKLFESFSPWNYSAQSNSEIREVIRKSLSVKNYNLLYSDSGQSELNPSFKKAIDNVLDATDLTGESFKTKVTKIREDLKLNQITVDLNIDLSLIDGSFYNEYFYIVDRLFREHLTAADAGKLWSMTKKNEKALINTASAYIKTELIAKIFETHSFMNKLFYSKEAKRSNAIFIMIQQSLEMTNKWSILMNRIKRLDNFVGAHVRTTFLGSNDFNAFAKSLNSIGRNLKLLVTGPMTMIMAHFMALMDSKIEFVDSWGNKVEFLSRDIIKLFYNVTADNQKQMGTWLKFGNDNGDLTLVEMVYSFSFAALTQTFENFGANDFSPQPNFDLDASRVKFLDVLVEKFLSEYKKSLVDFKNKVSSDTSMNAAISNCSDVKANRAITQTVEFEKMGSYLLFGNQIHGDISKINAGINLMAAADSSSPLAKNKMISNRSKIMFVESLIEIAKLEAKQKISNPVLLKNFEDRLDLILKPLHELHRETFSLLMTRYRSISDCVSVLSAQETKLQAEALALEKAHLELVYDDFESAMKETNSQKREELINSANLKYKVTKNHDLLTSQYYRYSKFDFYSRLEQLLLKKGVNVSKGNVDLIDFYTTPVTHLIPFVFQGKVLGKNEFVSKGLQLLSSATAGSGSFVTWLGDSAFNEHLVNKVELAFELFTFQFLNKELLNKTEVEKMTLQDLIIAYKELIKFTSLSNDQIEMMRILKLPSKFAGVSSNASAYQSLKGLDGVFLNPASEEQRYLLDTAFEKLVDYLDLTAFSLEFYKSMEHMGSLLFKPKLPVEGVLMSKYKPFYQQSIKQIREFIAIASQNPEQFVTSVGSFKNNDQMSSPLYFVNLNDEMAVFYSKSNSVLIGPNLIGKFNDGVTEFVEKTTQNFFKE
jgi:hypothetical protein